MPRKSPSQTEPKLVHSGLRVWMAPVTGPAEEGGKYTDLETMAVIISSVERRQHGIQVETCVPTASVAPGVVSIFSLFVPKPYLSRRRRVVNYITFAELWLRGPTEGEGVILSRNSDTPPLNSANPAYRPDEVAVISPGLCGFRKSLFLRDKFLSVRKWSR